MSLAGNGFRAGTGWDNLRAALVFLLLLVTPLPSLAQEEGVVDPAQLAPVILDGNTLFAVVGITGLPADERAIAIRERIIAIAEDPRGLDPTVETRPEELGQGLYIGETLLMVITEPDARASGVEDLSLLAATFSGQIEQAVASYRAERTASARQGGILQVAVWTIVFLLFTASLVFASHRVRPRVEKLLLRAMRAVEEKTQEIVRARAIADVIAVAMNGVFVVFFFVALYYYVSVVLFAFPESRTLATVLLRYVTDPVLGALRGVVAFLPSFVVLIFIFLVARYLIRLARVTFENIETGTVKIEGFQKHWVWPSFNILRAAIIILAFIVAFPYIPGSDSAAFQGISILLGVMVSIGSNSVVANILAGLFVIYRRSTNVGDRIEIGGHTGEVVAIKLTETHIKSFKNELISIPNAQLLNSEVINYSLHIDGRGLILHDEVGIGYDEPRQKVEALLIEAARRTNGIKKSPPPFVMRKALGDFAVTYEINGFSTRGDQIPRILSDLRGNILDVFHGEGVQIMSPHYEGDPETAKIPEVPAEDAKDAGKKSA